MRKIVPALLAGGLCCAVSASAQAEGTIKIGLIACMSGPFAVMGKQMENGITTWMKSHGDHVAGKKVELIVKDDGANPDASRRLAQELVTRDKVNVLMGACLTPNAMTISPVSTQSKTPFIVLNAATSSIVNPKAPYVTRSGLTQAQINVPYGEWAAKNKFRRMFVLVSDYGPGLDAARFFKSSFLKAGGQVVGEAHVPLKSPDFAPFLQKIKDVHPDAVFTFLPAGEQGTAFMKGFVEKELNKAGIRIVATGDMVDETMIDNIGDAALGTITVFNYSTDHRSAANAAFLKEYASAVGSRPRANFDTVAAYDAMHMVYDAANRLHGNLDPDKFMSLVRGMKFESPRGPISIDPATREIVQNVYVRRVERKGGLLQNVEFATFPNVKDPAK